MLARRNFLISITAVSAISALSLPVLAETVYEHPEFISHDELWSIFGNWLPSEVFPLIFPDHPVPLELHEEKVAQSRAALKLLAKDARVRGGFGRQVSGPEHIGHILNEYYWNWNA